LLSPATLGIVAFRRRFDGIQGEATIERLNAELLTKFELTGRGLVSSTRLRGRYAIRMCAMNHTTGPADVIETLAWFATAARPDLPRHRTPARHEDPFADVRGGWADAVAFDEPTIRAIPLFAELAADAIEVLVRSAHELRASAGEALIHRWHGTRHFYVIVTGAVEVRAANDGVHDLKAGDFFGELAALDWGAGFGYARTADVVARTDSRLLVMPPAALGELLRRAPEVEVSLRAAARERLREI
jgi:hypothetical protein